MRIRKIQETHQEISLEEAFKNFLYVKQAQQISDTTMHDYQRRVEKFLEASHNSLDYRTLESDTLKFFSSIPDTSPARYNSPYQYINAFFNWLVDEEYIPQSPIKAHRLRKKKDEGNIKPVDIKGLQTFLDALDKHSFSGLRAYTIILVMLDTGIRTREVLSISEKDYSRTDGTIIIRKTVAKTRQERMVYLSQKTVKAIESFIRIKPKEWGDFLFPNYEGGQLTTTYLDKDFAKISSKCGVKITPYQLRHSFATLYLKNGGDLFTLQKQMGHSDLRMTKRYTEIDNDFLMEQHKNFSPITMLKENSRIVRV